MVRKGCFTGNYGRPRREERLSRDRDEESWRDREAFLNKENGLFEPVFVKNRLFSLIASLL